MGDELDIALGRKRKEKKERGQPVQRRQETRRPAAASRSHGPARSGNKEAPANRWKYVLLIALTVGGGLPLLFQTLEKVTSLFVPRVTPLSVSRPEELYSVFFGGEPWLVVCSKQNDTVPPVVKSAIDLAGMSSEPAFRAGILDCSARLPSGQTTLERFSLSSPSSSGSADPLVFYVANGAKPQPLPMGYFTDPKEGPAKLVQLIKARTEKKVFKATSQAQLKSRCLDRKSCLLILHPAGKLAEGQKQTLDAVMRRHRATAFVLLNSSKLRLSIDSALPEAAEGEPRAVYFKSSSTAPSKGGKARAHFAKAHRGGFDASSLISFLDTAADEALPLSKPVTLSAVTRPRPGSSSSSRSRSGSTRTSPSPSRAKAPSGSSTKAKARTEGKDRAGAKEAPREPPQERGAKPASGTGGVDPHAEPWADTEGRRGAQEEEEEMEEEGSVVDLDDEAKEQEGDSEAESGADSEL